MVLTDLLEGHQCTSRYGFDDTEMVIRLWLEGCGMEAREQISKRIACDIELSKAGMFVTPVWGEASHEIEIRTHPMNLNPE